VVILEAGKTRKSLVIQYGQFRLLDTGAGKRCALHLKSNQLYALAEAPKTNPALCQLRDLLQITEVIYEQSRLCVFAPLRELSSGGSEKTSTKYSRAEAQRRKDLIKRPQSNAFGVKRLTFAALRI